MGPLLVKEEMIGAGGRQTVPLHVSPIAQHTPAADPSLPHILGAGQYWGHKLLVAQQSSAVLMVRLSLEGVAGE